LRAKDVLYAIHHRPVPMRATSRPIVGVLVAFAAMWARAYADETAQHFRDADCARLARPIRATCALASQNELPALVEIGRRFASGNGVDRDATQAARAFRLAADQGHPLARYELGVLTEEGRGVVRDQERATQLFRLAAQQGLAEAQLRLAAQYQLGRGVAQDYREAVAWLIRAADQGNARALTMLGQAHEDGLGIDQDFTRAAALYQQAAELGDAEAHWHLGALLEHGRGVARNLEAAALHYQRAAERRIAPAQNALAAMYRDGRGVARNLEAAALHYQRAAERRIAPAQNALAAMYRDGRGVARNDNEALRLFREAAGRGLPAAQFNLAQMLERNPAALVEAIRWYRSAAASGVHQAETEIDRLLAAAAAPRAPQPAPTPSADAVDRHSENLFWQTALQLGAAPPFEDYLRRWPRGQFASLAQAQLARLRAPSTQPQASGEAEAAGQWSRDAAALHLFGYLADATAAAGGEAARAAIRRFQIHEGGEPTGSLTDAQRAQLQSWAQNLQTILVAPPVSPAGIAATALGRRDPRFRRGWQHENGQGAARDDAEAVYWYRLAAADGSREALNNLGLRYARGQGVAARDIATAFMLWRAAAVRGDANAAFNLAAAYERGIGVAAAPEAARRWYAVARDAGSQEARNALARLR
jgi:uncharacterized protein